MILIPQLTSSSHISSAVTKYLFLSVACHSTVLKNGEMDSLGSSVSSVNIMAINLAMLFGYYTFINNQISIQKPQEAKLRKRTESMGGMMEFLACSLMK